MKTDELKQVWFHGTRTWTSVAKIRDEGFKEGTYFARHMEDAVIMGGAHIFFVRVAFEGNDWQACCSNRIPASAIIGECFVNGIRALSRAVNKI